jgi:hypothetical protein
MKRAGRTVKRREMAAKCRAKIERRGRVLPRRVREEERNLEDIWMKTH